MKFNGSFIGRQSSRPAISVIGAQGPEMDRVENALCTAGITVLYATFKGVRVNTETALCADVPNMLYGANPIDREPWPWHALVIRVGCAWASNEESRFVHMVDLSGVNLAAQVQGAIAVLPAIPWVYR
jgi:hypothetical protein